MRKAIGRRIMLLGILIGCCLAGCVTAGPTTPPSAPPPPADPLVVAILKQEILTYKVDGKDVKSDPPQVKPDPVLHEVPLHTPLADAREIMERHGFTCWEGIKDNYQMCLYCTAYRRKTPFLADRVTVKLYYEDKRVTNATVIIETGVKRGTGLFSDF